MSFPALSQLPSPPSTSSYLLSLLTLLTIYTSLVLFLWDWASHLKEELELVWFHQNAGGEGKLSRTNTGVSGMTSRERWIPGKKAMKWTFLASRYLALLQTIFVVLLLSIGRSSSRVCNLTRLLPYGFSIVSFASHLVMVLRMFGLFGHLLPLLIILFSLSILDLVVQLVADMYLQPIMYPLPSTCYITPSSPIFALTFISPSLFHHLILVLTLWGSYKHVKNEVMVGGTLMRTLRKGQIGYVLTICLVNFTNVILVLQSSSPAYRLINFLPSLVLTQLFLSRIFFSLRRFSSSQHQQSNTNPNRRSVLPPGFLSTVDDEVNQQQSGTMVGTPIQKGRKRFTQMFKKGSSSGAGEGEKSWEVGQKNSGGTGSTTIEIHLDTLHRDQPPRMRDWTTVEVEQEAATVAVVAKHESAGGVEGYYADNFVIVGDDDDEEVETETERIEHPYGVKRQPSYYGGGEDEATPPTDITEEEAVFVGSSGPSDNLIDIMPLTTPSIPPSPTESIRRTVSLRRPKVPPPLNLALVNAKNRTPLTSFPAHKTARKVPPRLRDVSVSLGHRPTASSPPIRAPTTSRDLYKRKSLPGTPIASVGGTEEPYHFRSESSPVVPSPPPNSTSYSHFRTSSEGGSTSIRTSSSTMANNTPTQAFNYSSFPSPPPSRPQLSPRQQSNMTRHRLGSLQSQDTGDESGDSWMAPRLWTPRTESKRGGRLLKPEEIGWGQ